MRKSLKIGLAVLPAVVALAGFAACGEKHTHTYSDVWSSDGDSHWHEATCKHAGEVGDKAKHTFSENKNFDGEKHWYECTVCEYRKDEASHNPVNGVCECGYVDSSLRLVYKLVSDSYAVSVNSLALNDKGFTSVEIPAEYEGKPVTAIAENGFNGAKYLKEVKLPSSLTAINDYAFQDCESLTKIELPADLTTLGNQVFAGCGKLASINIPASITELGVNLFLDCKELASVTLASDLKIVRAQAFANCEKLTSFTVPSTVAYIGMKAFKGTGLTEITVPESVTEIHSYAFEDCTSLVTAAINAKNTNFTGAIFNGCTKLQTLTIPFVGQDEHPLDSQTSSFGFIFGTYSYGKAGETYTAVQGGKTYYIPASLTTLTVNGGQVKAGALDNLTSLRSVTYGEDVEIEVAEFEGCTAVFDWKAAPTLTNVKLQKDGADATAAGLNETLTLSYEAGLFTTVSVTVKKGGEVVTAGGGYSYNAVTKELVFTAYGDYTVEVTATRGGKDTTASLNVAVENTEAAKAEVTFAWAGDVTNTAEGDTVTFSAECTYGAGATKGTEEYSVYVLSGTNYENADESVYELNETDKTFTPKFGGTYRIVLAVTTREGAVTKEQIDLTVAVSELEFSGITSSEQPTNGWLRVLTNTEKTFTATLTSGYLAGYNLTFANAEGATVTANVSGNTITYTVSSAEANTATIKAVYTHRNDSSKKFEVAFPAVSFVTSEDAPILAEDPFDGTYGTLIPSVGMALYYDVTDKDGGAIENYTGVTYEIVASELTPAQVAGKTAEAAIMTDNVKYPYYVIAKNFEDNSTSGTITVKMTVTVDGQTAAASKTFRVTPLSSSLTMNQYMSAATNGATNSADIDLYGQLEQNGNDGVNHRQNCLITKTGIIFNRANASWFNYGDMLKIPVKETTDNRKNFTMGFDYTPLGRFNNDGNNPNMTNCSLALYFVPVSGWDGNSKLGIYSEAGTDKSGNAKDENLHCGNWGGGWSVSSWGTDVPDALGKTVHIKIVYTVTEGTATISVSWKLLTDTDYTAWTVMSGGSPLDRVQFTQECGSYAVEKLTFTFNN